MRRWPLYTSLIAAAFALELIVLRFTHANLIQFLASEFIVLPLAATIAYVFSGSDIFKTLQTPAERWERITERAWAIILIDFCISVAQIVSAGSLHVSGGASFVMGVLVLFMATMLMYAEPFAAMEQNVHAVSLIPLALMRSMMLAWVNILRICNFFALQVALIGVEMLLPRSKNPTLQEDALAAGLDAIVAVLLAILFTAAYADTLRQEREIVS